jgi:hypothetical protein
MSPSQLSCGRPIHPQPVISSGAWDLLSSKTATIAPPTLPGDHSLRRLPKLDPIPLRIGKPPKPPVLVILTFRIDSHSRRFQLVQNSVEIIHLKIQHGRLRNRKVLRRLWKKRHRDVSPLRFPGKRERSRRTADSKMLLIPRVKSLWIRGAQKCAAQPRNFSHSVSLIFCGVARRRPYVQQSNRAYVGAGLQPGPPSFSPARRPNCACRKHRKPALPRSIGEPHNISQRRSVFLPGRKNPL